MEAVKHKVFSLTQSTQIWIKPNYGNNKITLTLRLNKYTQVWEYQIQQLKTWDGLKYFLSWEIGVNIAIWHVSGHKTTEHGSFYDSNHNMLRGNVENIYCGTLLDNQKEVPIKTL